MSPDARRMILRYLYHTMSGVKLPDVMEVLAEYLGQQIRPLSPRRRNNALAEMRRLIERHIDRPNHD